MARDYEESATKRRVDKEIKNVVDYEMESLKRDLKQMDEKYSVEISELKAMPMKIIIGFMSLFGVSIGSLSYTMVSDHIQTSLLSSKTSEFTEWKNRLSSGTIKTPNILRLEDRDKSFEKHLDSIDVFIDEYRKEQLKACKDK